VLRHKALRGSLDAFADGTLPESQRAGVAAHLETCAECTENLRQIRRLDHVLVDLPPMQPVPFARFWSTLEPRLRNRAERRSPFFRPARLAVSFAIAVLASLVGVVALASDGTLPDSPLYSVKHFRQGVQLSLASPHDRARLDLIFGKQRVHEAAEMLRRKRDDLAVASLRDFRALMVDAAPRLENSTSKPDAAELNSAIAGIRTELTDVSAANLEPDGSTAEEIAAVDGAVQDARIAVTQVETEVDTTPGVVESPSPSPESASPSAEASPAASPSESPSPEASPEASASVPTEASPPPAP
jgi:hypothetical protein